MKPQRTLSEYIVLPLCLRPGLFVLAIAILASLILPGTVVGVRESSIICAISIGFLIGWVFKVFPYRDVFFTALSGRQENNNSELA